MGCTYVGYLLTESFMHFNEDHFARGRANTSAFVRDKRDGQGQYIKGLGPFTAYRTCQFDVCRPQELCMRNFHIPAFGYYYYTFTSKYYAVVLTIPFHSAFTTCA